MVKINKCKKKSVEMYHDRTNFYGEIKIAIEMLTIRDSTLT